MTTGKRHILAALLLAVATAVQAQTARWITANDTARNKPNTWIEFKKDFSVKRTKGVVARIAADSKYWLWVNGRQVVFEGGLKRGPNRTDTYYDAVDLGPWLRRGSNSVRLLLWHFGKPGFSHVNSGRAGLIFDAPKIGLRSDSTWQARMLSAYQTAGEPQPNFRLPESNIRYDARLEGKDSFAPALAMERWGEGPWGRLAPRPIPLWRDCGARPIAFTRSEEGGNVVLTARLPYNMQMTPVIDVEDEGEGTVIRLETDHVRGGSQDCVRAEYVTRRGRRSYESLGWMNGDVLRVIYPKEAAVTIHSLGYRETGYDCDREGTFSCPDSTMNRFWEKAMRTLYVNMRDTYFDCPDRERAQWWGDVTILMGQSFYQLSPRANALIRKAIRELVDWQKPDGTLFSPIPAENWDKELPAQMLASVSTYGFWYYYMNTGDRETMEYAYPAVRRYLSLWTLDDTGLTDYRAGGWDWGDWGTDVDMRLVLAAWHYLALRSAANMARLTGHDADTAAYIARMDSIRAAYNRCWNGYAYRHPSYQGATDDRAQAMAIVAGIADSTKHDRLFSLFKSQQYASPYMEKYVMEALVKTGHGNYAMKRFKKRFGPMIADTLHTTLYEGWREGGYGGGSTNHAWSGGMLTVVAEQVCGVRPTAPGWREFEVCPRPVLPEADITIPTMRGRVRSAFKDTKRNFTLSLTVPKGTRARVALPEADYREVLLDGKRADARRLASVKPGDHEIICVK